MSIKKIVIMLSSAHGSITLSVFFDTRRAIDGDKYPVKIRVRYKRDRKDYVTGKKLTEEEWNKLPVTKSAQFVKLRDEIQASFKIVDDIVLDLFRNDMFSFETLNTRLGKCTTDTINTAFAAKIEALRKDGAIGNMFNYQTAMRSIEAFAGNKIAFNDITSDWLKRYEKHLISEGKSYVTVSMYVRCIRAIMNDAKRAGTLKETQYPFGRDKYEVPAGEGRKLALTMEQIKAVITYTDGRETTERYRDLWFFSYLCNGVNFGDMLQLRYRDIENDEICWYRAKTIRTSKNKKKICATLTAEMQAIIDKWGNPDKKPDTVIFPYLNGDEEPIKKKKIILDVIKRTNKRLKIIGKAVGIEGLSTYTARHSYATVLKRSGANIAFISESLGHSDLKTTENYLASFEKEERKKNAALLTNF